MDFKDLVVRRYSVRNYFNKKIPQQDLDYVLECARLAPSAVNKQPWHFYICSTTESLNKIQKCYSRDWFKSAPCVIIACICHDEEWIRSQDSKPHGIVDISIAVEHICLAATEKGLGTCWVCNFDVHKVVELFNLPSQIEPAVLIPIGYPVSDENSKVRKEMNDIITEL